MDRGKEMGGRRHVMRNRADMVRCRAYMMGTNLSMVDSSTRSAKVMMDKRCSSSYSMVNRGSRTAMSYTIMMEHSRLWMVSASKMDKRPRASFGNLGGRSRVSYFMMGFSRDRSMLDWSMLDWRMLDWSMIGLTFKSDWFSGG